jgi:hypothetical protein
VSLVESPCACKDEPRFYEPDLLASADAYRKALAAFDVQHGDDTCPSSLAALESLAPQPPKTPPADGWHNKPFLLECTVSGTPAKRTVRIRHPGYDWAVRTGDDKIYSLDPVAPVPAPPTS